MSFLTKYAKNNPKIQQKLNIQLHKDVDEIQYCLMRILKDPVHSSRHMYQMRIYEATNRILGHRRYMKNPVDIYRIFQLYFVREDSRHFYLFYLKAEELSIEDFRNNISWYTKSCFTGPNFFWLYQQYQNFVFNECSKYRSLFFGSFEDKMDELIDHIMYDESL